MEVKNQSLEKIILDIESFDFHEISKRSENEMFELWRDPSLLKYLAGNVGAFFVRAILNKLSINEHHVFRWRLENKYRQYQVLNYYAPGSIAETISVSKVLSTDNGAQTIKELCENGFFIKATLGHRTGENNSFDRTHELDEIIQSNQKEHNHLEKWMLQKKLDLNCEFRIHTFGKDLLYGMTFITNGKDSSKSASAEEFLKGILEKLPDTILHDTLIGWDVAITNANEYYVIEANFTGFHPEFVPGFQTSGYFGDRKYGSILCAWLNNYFRIKYHISIGSVESSLLTSDQFYKEFVYYDSLIKNGHIEEFVRDKAGKTNISAIIYLGDEIDHLLIKLIRYFLLENFADRYYLIINEKNVLAVGSLFLGDIHVRGLIEDKLFTEDQYQLVRELSYERRKKICSYHALRVVKGGAYFMV